VASSERRQKRDGPNCAVRFDVQQNVGAIVVSMDINLKQLEDRRILLNELVSQACRLGLRVGGVLTAEELNRRSDSSAVILKFETDLLCRSDCIQGWLRRRPMTACCSAYSGGYRLSNHCM
jgi:hypothetical protein